jgi:hypothetical protein
MSAAAAPAASHPLIAKSGLIRDQGLARSSSPPACRSSNSCKRARAARQLYAAAGRSGLLRRGGAGGAQPGTVGGIMRVASNALTGTERGPRIPRCHRPRCRFDLRRLRLAGDTHLARPAGRGQSRRVSWRALGMGQDAQIACRNNKNAFASCISRASSSESLIVCRLLHGKAAEEAAAQSAQQATIP